MKRTNFCWLILVAHLSCNATEINNHDVSKLSFAECTFQNAKMHLWMAAMNNQAEIGKNKIKVNNELIKLVDKAPNPSQPIGEQLSPSDLSRFGEIRNQMIQMDIASLTESKRKRDLDFIERLIVVTDQMYRFGEMPKDDNDKKATAILFQTLEHLNFGLKMTVPEKQECSLDLAIAKLEDEPVNQLNQLSSNNRDVEVLNFIKSLNTKYNTPRIDSSKLNAEELSKYNYYEKSYIKPARDIEEHINVFEMLKSFERASEIRYESRKKDAMYGSTDVDRTFSKNTDDGLYDPITTTAIKTLLYLDKIIPSESSKELEERAREIEKSNKANTPTKTKKKKVSS